MHIGKDIELLDGLPIAYIKSINAIIVADLHLGYESHMAKSGVFIPKANLGKILKELNNGIARTGAKRIIVVGDIKNEFSSVEQDEFNELYEIIKFCRGANVELVLVKGNHDNFIDRYRDPLKLKTYNGEAMIGDYLFFHGDKLPKLTGKKPKMLISGHEHPSIGIVNFSGRTERLRCFLLGEYRKTRLLVLPAISYFATGTDINLRPEGSLLSPVLKEMDLGKVHAIAFGYGSTLDFGAIGNLRKLAHA
ncbi:MAG: metallophosphoesterase [Candidatus Micrarchaeota archaeon]|nr:metallophosphoesterase [Candidatus Micrarchaeota archaeon]